MCGKSAGLVSLIQRANAILKTATPASAARLAAGSLTPRRRSAPASAAAKDASLISSRSWKVWVRVDDGLAPPGDVAALLKEGADGLQGRG